MLTFNEWGGTLLSDQVNQPLIANVEENLINASRCENKVLSLTCSHQEDMAGSRELFEEKR